MIVYQSDKAGFQDDVSTGEIDTCQGLEMEESEGVDVGGPIS